MSEKHYPAKSVENDDIVLFDIAKMVDDLMSQKFGDSINVKIEM